ncbi:MAG: YcxB family protein [Bacteroidota bacterium]
MIIKTRKTRLTPSKYIRLALWNIFRQQWWLSLIVAALSGGLFYMEYVKSAIVPPVLLLLYVLFWVFQFYTLTRMDESKLLFERLFYEFNKERVVIYLDSKRGMPIDWKHVMSAREGKDHFMLMLSKAHFIYIPYGAFQNQQQVNLVRMLLKGKKLL